MTTAPRPDLRREEGGLVSSATIAYFTMEIALRPEMHTYSGGLGVLAGDSARSAADLGLPMVFVTLVSRLGYLRQTIDGRGDQVDEPDPWEPSEWATLLDAKVAVRIGGRAVWVRAWLYQIVGGAGTQVPVLLLDTDVELNEPGDRRITDRLYGGDQAYRLAQEAVLGIGGVRMLRALGCRIRKYHLNEGHSALLAAELLRAESTGADVRAGEPRYQIAAVRRRCIFTTHTPVAAGHDRFSYDLVSRLLGDEVDLDALRALAGADALNMAYLALGLSSYVNGVSKRHAEVSREMFPGHAIHAVTNGVHLPTWASPYMARLFDRHIPGWRQEPELLARADILPDAEVQAAHRAAKRRLIDRIHGDTGVAMDADVTLVGFARRITGYKRVDLVLSDLDRLLAISARTPVQFVLAGKAHSRDEEGRDAIHRIHARIRDLTGRVPVAFLPGYGLELAHLLVSGADVWLNNPLPPLEASGTSGMKAALNGVLNLSVLDGWWIEGCIEGRTGWGIADPGTLDRADAAHLLYDRLGDTVLRLHRNDPARWTWMMKQAIAVAGSYFSSHRMMRQYATEAYLR